MSLCNTENILIICKCLLKLLGFVITFTLVQKFNKLHRIIISLSIHFSLHSKQQYSNRVDKTVQHRTGVQQQFGSCNQNSNNAGNKAPPTQSFTPSPKFSFLSFTDGVFRGDCDQRRMRCIVLRSPQCYISQQSFHFKIEKDIWTSVTMTIKTVPFHFLFQRTTPMLTSKIVLFKNLKI